MNILQSLQLGIVDNGAMYAQIMKINLYIGKTWHITELLVLYEIKTIPIYFKYVKKKSLDNVVVTKPTSMTFISRTIPNGAQNQKIMFYNCWQIQMVSQAMLGLHLWWTINWKLKPNIISVFWIIFYEKYVLSVVLWWLYYTWSLVSVSCRAYILSLLKVSLIYISGVHHWGLKLHVGI